MRAGSAVGIGGRWGRAGHRTTWPPKPPPPCADPPTALAVNSASRSCAAAVALAAATRAARVPLAKAPHSPPLRVTQTCTHTCPRPHHPAPPPPRHRHQRPPSSALVPPLALPAGRQWNPCQLPRLVPREFRTAKRIFRAAKRTAAKRKFRAAKRTFRAAFWHAGPVRGLRGRAVRLRARLAARLSAESWIGSRLARFRHNWRRAAFRVVAGSVPGCSPPPRGLPSKRRRDESSCGHAAGGSGLWAQNPVEWGGYPGLMLATCFVGCQSSQQSRV